MRAEESRRLTGPGLLGDRPGAAIEALWEPGDDPATRISAWGERVAEAFGALDLGPPTLHVHDYGRGATLAFDAPPDRLYAATEINEWAAGDAPLAGAIDALRAALEDEAKPALLALLAEASRRDVPTLLDDDALTVGLGAHGETYPLDALPSPDAIAWEEHRGVPVALVTGTNGKSTTTRLLARCVRAGGVVVGLCTTDEIRVDGELLEAGDWTGPGAARRVLRDRRVQTAVLETARGGILRRGLGVAQADVAVITNVAADHLGDWGVDDVPTLARAKATVARVVRPGGSVVLNGEDENLRALAPALGPGRNLIWFSPDEEALPPGWREALTVRGGDIVHVALGHATRVVPVGEVPVTWGGAARFNVENALAAAAAALALGLRPADVAAGLRSLHPTADDNPARLNVVDVGGVAVVLDFGHNPHGLDALMRFVAAWRPGGRRTALLTQAGDRDDEAFAGLATTLVRHGVSRAIVRPPDPHYLRGRAPGEPEAVLTRAFIDAGLPAEAVTVAASEVASLEAAIAGASPGDTVLLLVHIDRQAVAAWLAARGARPLAGG